MTHDTKVLEAEIRRVGASLRSVGRRHVDHLEASPGSSLAVCGLVVPQSATPVDLKPCLTCARVLAAHRRRDAR